MDKLFLTILNMSLTGAFVIVAILLARLPLKKAPKIISYCLWTVVGFRLVFPFSIESIFSLMPIKPQPIPPDIAMQAVPRISGIPLLNNAVSSVLPAATPTASVNPLQIWMAIGAYVWLIGAAVMLLYGIVSYALLKRKMRTAIRVDGNVYETDNTQSPFVLGIVRPKIYLPLSLAVGEREYIILHERTHIRRRDHIVKFAAYFILCLHWFNPLAWAAFLFMGADMEMSCDERVLKQMGGDTKHDYSRSLLSLATGRRVIGGSPLAFGEGGVKERVNNVLNFRKPSRVIITLAVALVAVLSVGFTVNQVSGKQPFKDIDADEITSILLYCTPPDVSVNIEDKSTISEIADILRTVVTYEKDYLGEKLAGQLVQYTLTMRSGETIEVGALGSFIVIDGQLYKTKYEPSEELNRLGNQLRGDKKSPYQKAMDLINEHYPNFMEIISTGIETISYADPPTLVEIYTFDVVVDGERIACAVSKEQGIFFNHSDGHWFAFAGMEGLPNPIFTDLEATISQTILEENKDGYNPGDFSAEAHTTLAISADPSGNQVTAYLMVLYQNYGYRGGGFSGLGGSHMPVARTFEKGTDGSYTMTEYWTPQDGAYNAPSIKEKFPADIYEDALDTQKYIYAHVISCYEQAIEYGKVDTGNQIALLIDTICSSPGQASNPGAYIEAHSIEFRELVYYSRYTLDYCFTLFEQGGQAGLEGHIMAAACRDIMTILGEPFKDGSFSTGQDWYNAQ